MDLSEITTTQEPETHDPKPQGPESNEEATLTAEELNNAAEEESIAHQIDGTSAWAEHVETTETGEATIAPLVEDDVAPSPPTIDNNIIADQPVAAVEEMDAVSSVAGMSDVRSEATTVVQELPAQDSKKKPKIKGPAQTESLSAFGSKKSQRKASQAQKNKAKKEEKMKKEQQRLASGASNASHTAPKTPTDSANNDVKARDNNTILPEIGSSTSSASLVDAKEKGKLVDHRMQVQPDASESSSMAGTPKTAREYPGSASGTPTRDTSTGNLGSGSKSSIWSLLFWFL